jgi:hypothetical protein
MLIHLLGQGLQADVTISQEKKDAARHVPD